jgi:alpha-tubulin suppressor-like RCC1 family protein
MLKVRRYSSALVGSLVSAALILSAAPVVAQTVAAGQEHTVILKSDGTVWTVGTNSSGQLGDGTTTPRTEPVQVSGLTDVVAVAAGYYHSMAITSTGALSDSPKCWPLFQMK